MTEIQRKLDMADVFNSLPAGGTGLDVAIAISAQMGTWVLEDNLHSCVSEIVTEIAECLQD